MVSGSGVTVDSAVVEDIGGAVLGNVVSVDVGGSVVGDNVVVDGSKVVDGRVGRWVEGSIMGGPIVVPGQGSGHVTGGGQVSKV